MVRKGGGAEGKRDVAGDDLLRTSFGSNEDRPITHDRLTEMSPLLFHRIWLRNGNDSRRSDSMNRLDLYAGKIYDKPKRIYLLLRYVLIMIVIRLVFPT